MGKDSAIEWCDATFNPWWGCIKVSEECEHCYALTLAERYGHKVWGPAKTTPRRFFGEKHWNEPLRWDRDARLEGERRRVFCASMADVFEDNPALDEERGRLWSLIRATPHLDWLLLTKRPENITRMVPDTWLKAPMRNVWYGASVGLQSSTWRIPELLTVPAAVRFLSCEPLLGPLDLKPGLWIPPLGGGPKVNLLRPWDTPLPSVDWVIVGGESGPKSRPMHPDWARSLRDQCQAAGVAFFFKQWGEWGPVPYPVGVEIGGDLVLGMKRLGKKAAGRVLDGRTWDEFPAAQRQEVLAR